MQTLSLQPQLDDDPPPQDIGAEGVIETTFETVTPAAWKGVEPVRQEWLAEGRVPRGDVTLFSGNGGAGKTETAVHLLVAVAAGLGDWLGSPVIAGDVLFLSGEEPEHNVRDRVERISRHRALDPYSLDRLHMIFPELDATWLVHAGRDGRMTRAPLMARLEDWVARHRPALIVVDSIAAVFDGEAIARRQVRAFLGMLRKMARSSEAAIVLLDHPSVRGMADGTGTANSVDWRNSVRSMLHLSDPDRDDQDLRMLEIKKSNYGRAGEKVSLRWSGLTFTTAMAGEASPNRAAAARDVEELFLKLLDKRQAQHRPVHAKNAKGSAPTEFAVDPDAGGISAAGFRAAMERMLSSGRIKVVVSGPASRRREHLERGND